MKNSKAGYSFKILMYSAVGFMARNLLKVILFFLVGALIIILISFYLAK